MTPATGAPRRIVIDGTVIDDDTPCYVIAEIGNNHQGSVEQCAEMLRVAQRCGADAVKLQRRDNRAILTSALRAKPYENENSFGLTYGEHRDALELPITAVAELLDAALDLGITLFSTAFDERSADELAAIGVPAFKIASGDLLNTPLIAHVARLGQPMILSTGGATLDDVRRAFDTARVWNDQVAVLQCTAGYPAGWDELDLRVINTYREEFPGAVIGFSSHDNGIAMACAGAALGARIVEKHFTLDRAMRGSDHRFSLEPQGLTKLVRDLQRLHRAMGDGTKRCYDSEREPIRKMAKSLYTVRPLPADHVLSDDDLVALSPADGFPPHVRPQLVGRRLVHGVPAEHCLTAEDLESRAAAPPSYPAANRLSSRLRR